MPFGGNVYGIIDQIDYSYIHNIDMIDNIFLAPCYEYLHNLSLQYIYLHNYPSTYIYIIIIFWGGACTPVGNSL